MLPGTVGRATEAAARGDLGDRHEDADDQAEERGALDERGMIVEFGLFKKRWRALLDDRLDHHLVVKRGDIVAEAILSVQPDARILTLEHDPTTEYLAMWIHEQSSRILQELDAAVEVVVRRVHLQETSVNAAEYEV